MRAYSRTPLQQTGRAAILKGVTKSTRGLDTPLAFPEAARSIVAELLADPALDPLMRLRDVVRHSDRLREEWVAAEAEADDIADPELLNEAQARERTAYSRWEASQQMIQKCEQEVRRRNLETALTGRWQDEYEDLVEQLKTQYEGLGPHYDVMCENTARLTVRLRMVDASGRDVSSGEIVELHKLQIAYIGQLQRYSEALKSQTVSKLTQEVAEQIVQLFERNVGTLYPELWQQCIVELRAMIETAA